jgi:hypothetical protein
MPATEEERRSDVEAERKEENGGMEEPEEGKLPPPAGLLVALVACRCCPLPFPALLFLSPCVVSNVKSACCDGWRGGVWAAAR